MAIKRYHRNTPHEDHDPSDDQPKMEENTNSLADVLAVNHVGFEEEDAGKHKFLDLKNLDFDPPTSKGSNQIYIKNGELILQKEDGTKITLLGKVSTIQSGYERLPSGRIKQWGQGFLTNQYARITFPIEFPTQCFGVNVTLMRSGKNYRNWHVVFGSVNKKTFDVECNSNASSFYWEANGW